MGDAPTLADFAAAVAREGRVPLDYAVRGDAWLAAAWAACDDGRMMLEVLVLESRAALRAAWRACVETPARIDVRGEVGSAYPLVSLPRAAPMSIRARVGATRCGYETFMLESVLDDAPVANLAHATALQVERVLRLAVHAAWADALRAHRAAPTLAEVQAWAARKST